MEIFDATQRRALERDVLKSLIENEAARKMQPSSDIFEVAEHRQLFDTLRRLDWDFVECPAELAPTLADVLGGNRLNGQFSIAVERLSSHRFDAETFPCTETGNAERYEQQHGDKARFDHKRGRWMLWDGIRWREAEMGQAVDLMTQTARSIYDEALRVQRDEERLKLAKWAVQSESKKTLQNSLELAQSLPSIRITTDRFDADPMLFNTLTHIINLRTMQAEPHDHRRLCSKVAAVEHNPHADCHWWTDEFLPRVFKNDVPVIDFVQQIVGYSLTGLTDIERLFFAYGTGRNGKSTFFEVLRLLFGDYYAKAPADLLLMKRDSIPLDIAMLQGKRFVVCSEIEQGRRLNESRMKDLTGGDTLSARRLYQDIFSFQPSHKLFIYGNHKPVVSGQDLGVWRRILLLPFAVTIPEAEQQDKSVLLAKAKKELPGILNWALEGLTRYQQRGLIIPQSVRVATESYRDESDNIAAFLNDCTQQSGEVSTGELYKAFVDWSGDTRLTSRAFIQSLQDKGYTLRVGHGRKRFWQGISLPADR